MPHNSGVKKTLDELFPNRMSGEQVRAWIEEETQKLPIEEQAWLQAQKDLRAAQRMVGQGVREAREKANLTQAALSAECGISQSEISKLETGRSNSTLGTILRVGQVIGFELVMKPTVKK